MKALASAIVNDNYSSNKKPNASDTCIFNSKPQIKSIPAISPREKHRYRVVLDGVILGDKLSLEEALAAAGMGGAK